MDTSRFTDFSASWFPKTPKYFSRKGYISIIKFLITNQKKTFDEAIKEVELPSNMKEEIMCHFNRILEFKSTQHTLHSF